MIRGKRTLLGILLAILIAGGVESASAQQFDFKKLKFMSGCWSARLAKDQTVEENWTSISENMMLATTRYFEKKRATNYEFTRIEKTDSGVVWSSISRDRSEPSLYRMTQLGDEVATWENPAEEFPQRIMYRMASDGALLVRNDRLGEEYDPRNLEVRFERVPCPGGKQ